MTNINIEIYPFNPKIPDPLESVITTTLSKQSLCLLFLFDPSPPPPPPSALSLAFKFLTDQKLN